MSSKFQNDAIFWVEVDKINPNPYQPRRDFNEDRLRDLAESIRQYGILQPLTVTRNEQVKDDGGLKVQYELIAGERRHRAAQMANLSQVPVIIRSGEEDNQAKLELAIIENLQREDLNPIERAEAFDQLADEFDFTHKEIAAQIGKSREYVSNSMRLLKLPEKIKQAIINGKMTEGHARPIMMLRDKPEEQETLFKEVIHKGLTVREAESIARRDAQDKVRKKKNKIDPETKALEDKLSDTFGTRVKIEERDVGGKLVIDFFSEDDLENIIKLVQGEEDVDMGDMMEQYVSSVAEGADDSTEDASVQTDEANQREMDTEEGEGKSMAETLGSMIAAARKQAENKGIDDNDQPETGFVNPGEEKEKSGADQVNEHEEVADHEDEKSADDILKTRMDTDEDAAEISRPENPPANPEGEASSPDLDKDEESEEYQPKQNQPTDDISEDAQSAENEPAVTPADNTQEMEETQPQEPEAHKVADEMSSSDISVPTGDDTPVSNEPDDQNPNEDPDETEAEEDEAEDEMYSVSNFSI